MDILDISDSMKIKEVSFERLRTFGDYENVRIGAVAFIDKDTPEGTLHNLRSWVDGEVDRFIGDSEVEPLKWRKERMQKEYDELAEKVKKLREVVKTLDSFGDFNA